MIGVLTTDWRTLLWRTVDHCIPASDRMTLLGETADDAEQALACCRATLKTCAEVSFDGCATAVAKNYADLLQPCGGSETSRPVEANISGRSALRARHVLIEQQRVAVEVNHLEMRRPVGGLVCLDRQREAARFQGALQFPDVLEVFQGLLVLRSPWVEGQDILVEHPLEQPDPGVPVLQDDPVLLQLGASILLL